mmetsp:Transcript_2377/g.7959  ORF Transcript_2377/g.7959 Transcript_2377/m.7959 type:complete len:201 (-) Transcript_2377:329-931(-)
MTHTMRSADMSDGNVSMICSSEPCVMFLKCRSSVVRNLTLSLASTYRFSSSPNWKWKPGSSCESHRSSTSTIRRQFGVFSCSHRVDNAADRDRQNSISASGPLPTGVFFIWASSAAAMAGVHSSSDSSSTATNSSSAAAVAGSVISMCGTFSRTSPVSCWMACAICEPNFCTLETNSDWPPPKAPPAPSAPDRGADSRGT